MGRTSVRAVLAALALLCGASMIHGADDSLTIPPLPRAVSGLGAIVSDGWVYVYGGHSGKTHEYSTETVLGTFHRINLKDPKAWEELPGGPILQGMNLAAHGGKIYRAGGMQPRNKPGEKADNHSLAEVASYDPATKKWEKLPPLPEPRSSHDVVVLGDTLYVVGGWTMASGEQPTWLKTMLTLDLSAKKPAWKAIEQPFERRALTAAAHDGKLYVLGGLTEKGISGRVDIYDPASGKWSTGPEVPEAGTHGFGPAACSAGGTLYLLIGDGNVFALNARGDGWEKRFTIKVPRIVGRLVTDGRHLIVVGGAGKEGNVAAVEVLTLPAGKATP
jgi:N-acetylneuraminic acid mutarotase